MTIVFKAKRFSVEKAKHPLPDGSIKETHYVLAPNGVGIIALDDQERILITREWRPKTNSHIWRIPSGGQEEGETPLETAHRELREETGFDSNILTPFSEMIANSSWYKQTQWVFIARNLFESPLNTGDEAIKPEIHFMTAKQVLDLLNDQQIIGNIAAGLYRFLHVHRMI